MFGKLKEVTWISKISLSRDRENNNRNCFVNKNINFGYLNSTEEFDDLLDHFQRQKIKLHRELFRRKCKT